MELVNEMMLMIAMINIVMMMATRTMIFMIRMDIN